MPCVTVFRRRPAGAPPVRLYFASDLHGSEKCFRKFLNGGSVYEADAMILGGDVAGKAIVPLTRDGRGLSARFQGHDHHFGEGDEDRLTGFRRLIADHGYYAAECDPGELAARAADGSLLAFELALQAERLRGWTELAAERLAPSATPLYWMLGNDDSPELASILEGAPWGDYVDGGLARIGDHEVVTLGYANPTPWETFRELPEPELEARLDALCARLEDPASAILNVHVPPFDSGLDSAPMLDDELTVQTAGGQTAFGPVGSTAVRSVLQRVQPALSLHGHVHESGGFRKLGRTLALNPGSDYATGALNGAIVSLGGSEVTSFQLVRG
jgi:Icc-related predicted phosphoesterase